MQEIEEIKNNYDQMEVDLHNSSTTDVINTEENEYDDEEDEDDDYDPE